MLNTRLSRLPARQTSHHPYTPHIPSTLGTHLHTSLAPGAHQALGDGLGDACKAAGTLLVVDTVAALGGVPLFADEWGIDCIYSGSQKCLSGPPGGVWEVPSSPFPCIDLPASLLVCSLHPDVRLLYGRASRLAVPPASPLNPRPSPPIHQAPLPSCCRSVLWRNCVAAPPSLLPTIWI